MLLKARELRQFALRAKEGEIGQVTDLYFSDESWIVRYLIVATGNWLERREVLISPMAFDFPLNPAAKLIPVSITREQVRNAPPVDTRKPVSRHYETRYYDHFEWPYYWVGGAGWGPYLTPADLARAAGKDGLGVDAPENPHLRSADEVEGYGFEGKDGKLGHVEDLIVDDQNWSVRYLEIDTRSWWPGGKKVLLATELVSEVNWTERTIATDLVRDTVKHAPEYDDSAPITEDYERSLEKHYRLSRSVGAFR